MNLNSLTKTSLMIQLRYFISTSLILFIAFSCTSTLKFTKTYPREIDLKNNDSIIQYVNLYDVSLLDFNNDQRIEVYASGIKEIENGLSQDLHIKHGFELFTLDTAIKGIASSNFTEQLSTDSVKYFCSLNNTPLLLTLEAYDLSYDKRLKKVENEEGKKESKADYYLIVKAGLSLYDSTGLLIDRSEMQLEEYMGTRDVVVLGAAFRPSYGNKKDHVDRMSFNIGRCYIDKYFRTDHRESRMYYTGKDFSEITPLIETGEWEKAIALLVPLANSSNPKIAKKARHNIGVLQEALGEN